MTSRNGVVQRGAVQLDRPVNFRTSSFKSRLPPSQPPGSALRRSSPTLFGSAASKDDGVPGRVRVAVWLRPRNAEEMMADADFADCVELQPESVLDGYNGTVMAYGQTGTGKTFTLGQVGEEDTSDRGIMVRSMEDVLADISPRD